MVQARIHFASEAITAEFESDFAFTKWLGYLKEHGLATVKLAGAERQVIVFSHNITYIETEGNTPGIGV